MKAVQPYPTEKRVRLATCVAKFGDNAVADAAGVYSGTVLRVVGGKGVTPAIAAALDRAVHHLAPAAP